jgi:hypothetical protein
MGQKGLKMGYGKERPCKKCSEVKPVVARGLCSACFAQEKKAGTLENFPVGSPATRIKSKNVDVTDLVKRVVKDCIEVVEIQASRYKAGSWDQMACLAAADSIREKYRLAG